MPGSPGSRPKCECSRRGADPHPLWTGNLPRASTLFSMTIRTKLLLGFLGLQLASTLLNATLLWLAVDQGRRTEKVVQVYDLLEHNALELRLDMMVMSDAMRGFMLNPRDVQENARKLAADSKFTED